MVRSSHKTKFGERSTRQLRQAEIVRNRLSQIFNRGDLHDPELFDKSITVTEVQITSDMKYATVYVCPLGSIDQDSLIKALQREAPRLNHLVAQVMTSRSTPRLTFKLETIFDQASHLEELLSDPKVQLDIQKSAEPSEDIG